MSEESKTIEDWWVPYQVELVKDSSRIWQRRIFQPTAGIWKHSEKGRLLSKRNDKDPLPTEGVMDSTAWDHEHCQLCWETISEHGDYQKEGYTDGQNWLCVSCYNKYIAPEKQV